MNSLTSISNQVPPHHQKNQYTFFIVAPTVFQTAAACLAIIHQIKRFLK
ncbi:hypothetical protein [Neisseria iguanae]|nr:hypothetical protein [Neisseria iguanae]